MAWAQQLNALVVPPPPPSGNHPTAAGGAALYHPQHTAQWALPHGMLAQQPAPGSVAASIEAEASRRVAVVLHFLLSNGHITADTAVRTSLSLPLLRSLARPRVHAVTYVGSDTHPRACVPRFIRGCTTPRQLLALQYVTPLAHGMAAAPAPARVARPPKAPRRVAAPKSSRPVASPKPVPLAVAVPEPEEEPEPQPGDGRRSRRRKRSRLDDDVFVPLPLGPGPAPGATNDHGTGPKARLRWTGELKDAFDTAVQSLGGLVFAQPAQILAYMRAANNDVPPQVTCADGQTITLSLNHLKSFLQKKRLVAIQEGTLDPADIGSGRASHLVYRANGPGSRAGTGPLGGAAAATSEYDEDGDGNEGHVQQQQRAWGGAMSGGGHAAASKRAPSAVAAAAVQAALPLMMPPQARVPPSSAARLLALLAATDPPNKPAANGGADTGSKQPAVHAMA